MVRAFIALICLVALTPAAAARDRQPAAESAGSHNFRDCPTCPEMVTIPTGEFLMGSPESERGRGKDEGPQHKVAFAKPFAAGKFEVTFAEWDACVAEGGCTEKPSDEGWGRARHPVINVSWNDATQFVAWLSKKTGKSYRLLSEAEWEYAARGQTKTTDPSTPFSTGATINYQKANYDANFTYNGSPPGLYRQKTVDVGSLPHNAFGLHESRQCLGMGSGLLQALLRGRAGRWLAGRHKRLQPAHPSRRRLELLPQTSTFCLPLCNGARSPAEQRRVPGGPRSLTGGGKGQAIGGWFCIRGQGHEIQVFSALCNRRALAGLS